MDLETLIYDETEAAERGFQLVDGDGEYDADELSARELIAAFFNGTDDSDGTLDVDVMMKATLIIIPLEHLVSETATTHKKGCQACRFARKKQSVAGSCFVNEAGHLPCEDLTGWDVFHAWRAGVLNDLIWWADAEDVPDHWADVIRKFGNVPITINQYVGVLVQLVAQVYPEE